jgi:hypothetical protein
MTRSIQIEATTYQRILHLKMRLDEGKKHGVKYDDIINVFLSAFGVPDHGELGVDNWEWANENGEWLLELFK